MPTVNNTGLLTLSEWAASLGPDHKINRDIIDMLSQENQILADATQFESNLPLGHQGTVVVGLPPSYYIGFNMPAPVTKGSRAPIQEPVALLRAYSEVGGDEGEIGGKGELGTIRLIRGREQLESFNQTMAQNMIYGNAAVNSATFNGLATRYGAISAGGPISQNIIDCGGTGSTNTSIWLASWGGPEKLSMFFPMGSVGGVQHMDLGYDLRMSLNGTDGAPQYLGVWRDEWTWKHGLWLADWRYVVRMANIDVPSLLAKTAAANIIDLAIFATSHLPNIVNGKSVFYMNRTTFAMLRRLQRDDVIRGGGATMENINGVLMPMLAGLPVRFVDRIINTEGRVV